MTLRILTTIAASAALALTLSACGANSGAQLQALQAIVTDPNCQHDDKIAVVTGAGGIAGSFTATAERHCPVRGQPVPAPAPGVPPQ